MEDAITFRVMWLGAPQFQDDLPLRLDLEQVSTPLTPPPPRPGRQDQLRRVAIRGWRRALLPAKSRI